MITNQLAEVALRFCLSNPAVSCVIPGMMTIEHMRANTRVSDGELLPKELLEARPVIYVAFGDSVTQGCMEYNTIEQKPFPI